jgi:anaerobic magnesium-protoporphyrin IX monomethyl ester cyclase
LVDVILTPNTRPDCAEPKLIYYTAGGVFLALEQKGIAARFVDLMSDGMQKLSGPVCCFAVFFGNKTTALRQMQELRKDSPATRIIAFGPFASVFAEEILSRDLADIVVAHDPEFVIPLLLQDPGALSAVPNISYKHEGKIVQTQKQSFHDLDALPLVGSYLYSQGHPRAFVLTARGCQYHCVFCDRNVLWGGGVRQRSVENVLSEIKKLVEEQGAQRIRFIDEDLPADRRRLTALCEGMRRIKGEFYWKCSACVDSVSRELLILMAHARCRGIYFGIESASPQVLRQIGKKYGREEILNAVRWAQEAGLETEVMVTVGNPGETDADRDLTLSALSDLGPNINIITNRVAILPGTALYRRGLREGRFSQKSFFEDEGIIFYDEQGTMPADARR